MMKTERTNIRTKLLPFLLGGMFYGVLFGWLQYYVPLKGFYDLLFLAYAPWMSLVHFIAGTSSCPEHPHPVWGILESLGLVLNAYTYGFLFHVIVLGTRRLIRKNNAISEQANVDVREKMDEKNR